MRTLRCTLSDAYKVHKTYAEHLHDTGQKEPADLYQSWKLKLTSDHHKYMLLLHGKKIIGMLWGREVSEEVHPTFLIEGTFLRRAYRKMKFNKELLALLKSVTKDFHTVWMVKHVKNATLKKSTKIQKVLVELKKK